MKIVPLHEHSDKIVLYGQSCVGKTTFAHQLTDHAYYCFDAWFPWHEIETLNLPISLALEQIKLKCVDSKFILDGWHLADATGQYLPPCCVYVLYAPYEEIIRQYRIPVDKPDQHRAMFRKWYHSIDYCALPGTRYFFRGAEQVRPHFVDWLASA